MILFEIRLLSQIIVIIEYLLVMADDSVIIVLVRGNEIIPAPVYIKREQPVVEPCGLSQLIAMRYGAIPIVRETGGLKDTVHQFDPETKEGNGYTFSTYNAHDMLSVIQDAVDTFHNDKDAWKKLTDNALKSKFDWKSSADKYLEYYKEITGRLS